VGTCNWADHKRFYPEGLPPSRRLQHYAEFFPLVEADTTFYGVPRPEVGARWAEETPEDFTFNVKAHRALTFHERVEGHARPPEEKEVREFQDFLVPLRASGKLRGVHYQFPPWFTAQPRNFDYLASLPERHPDDTLIIEMRHRSWAEGERFDQLMQLLEEAGMSYCIVDEPQLGSGSMPRHMGVPNPKLAVVRFHGRNHRTWYAKAPTTGERFNYLYSEQELEGWVPRIRTLAEAAEEVHLLFNNNRSNYAVVNGLQLARLLDLGLPPPDAVPAPEPHAEQGRLDI
jgi:uncharacterized protein YecE (DUF72 family)